MHPTTGVSRKALTNYTMLQAVGWPTETALCVSRLIFSGIFERHPDLNLILAHGGGALPMLLGRLDGAYHAPKYEYNPECHANISHNPTFYLKNIYVDTMVLNPKILKFIIDLVGHEQVVFGSDGPFEISDLDGTHARAAIKDMSNAVSEAIFSGNAVRKLLKGTSFKSL